MKYLYLFLILLLPVVSASSGQITLLTVSEEDIGGTASINLEIKPGNGRIFIDSFPLSKLDTQISTRFANEVACDFLDVDCTRYDFFYTIRAKATIVGGPSAGGAITVLTIAVLDDLDINPKTTMTGTINSGGLIGPVAGIEAKVKAASKERYEKVIIPRWQNTDNLTLDSSIQVVKVRSINEALYEITGKQFETRTGEIQVREEYTATMKEVSDVLCQRTDTIPRDNNNESVYEIADDYINRSNQINDDYYSKASYCFSANLRLRNLQYENKTQSFLEARYISLAKDILEFDNKTSNKNISTLSNLQTYMIVKERISEAYNVLEEINITNISGQDISYVEERFFSAIAWSNFFDLIKDEINLNKEYLSSACLKKAAEADERINYAKLYLTGLGFTDAAEQEVDEALILHEQGEDALCIFKASKAKAEANILLTAISLQEEDMEIVVEEKIEALRQVLLEQEEKGLFPMMGYSYYEYVKSLKDHDTISSLTFTEYGLELSKLDMYFPSNKRHIISIDKWILAIFIFGFITGACTVIMIKTLRDSKKYRNLPGKKR